MTKLSSRWRWYEKWRVTICVTWLSNQSDKCLKCVKQILHHMYLPHQTPLRYASREEHKKRMQRLSRQMEYDKEEHDQRMKVTRLKERYWTERLQETSHVENGVDEEKSSNISSVAAVCAQLDWSLISWIKLMMDILIFHLSMGLIIITLKARS